MCCLPGWVVLSSNSKVTGAPMARSRPESAHSRPARRGHIRTATGPDQTAGSQTRGYIEIYSNGKHHKSELQTTRMRNCWPDSMGANQPEPSSHVSHHKAATSDGPRLLTELQTKSKSICDQPGWRAAAGRRAEQGNAQNARPRPQRVTRRPTVAAPASPQRRVSWSVRLNICGRAVLGG